MKTFASMLLLIVGATVSGVPGSAAAAATGGTVDFQRDIRPILSDICFNCHGPDVKARKAKLRLDTQDGALKDLGGYAAVVPGQPGKSELIRRITSGDPDEKMPPPEHPRQLTPQQIELFRRWIAEGAVYQQHWSFQPIVCPPVPNVTHHASRITNPIDNFVFTRLEKEGLNPSPPADPHTLIRRLSFDLTGLPPTPEEVDAFVRDYIQHPESSIQHLVSLLLNSPRYGERMAMDWLDVARYADSNGYFRDNARQAWPWRDWVIRAFNENIPYDQFTIWQLAGDLLPSPIFQLPAPRPNHRHRFQPQPHGHRRDRHHRRGISDRICGRPAGDDRHRVARADHRMLPLPRP